MGHVRMMSAVQPFLSGAISKTVNMPNDATVEEIADVYMQGWKLGLKAIAIYRDGCKRTQPLNTSATKNDDAVKGIAADARGRRDRRPRPRRLGGARPRAGTSCPTSAARSRTSSPSAGHEGYVTVGLYEDGTPGEIFLTMAKEGSTISGLMDSFATAISLTLQYGVPLEALVEKFSHMRFEPAGYTKNPEIPIAKSLVDYIFRWLASKFLTADLKEKAGVISREEPGPATAPPGLQVPRSTLSPVAGGGGRPDRGRVPGDPAIGGRPPPSPPSRARSGSPCPPAPRSQAHVREQRGRPELPRVREPHGAERRLLQVPELRRDERLQLRPRRSGPGRLRGARAAPLAEASALPEELVEGRARAVRGVGGLRPGEVERHRGREERAGIRPGFRRHRRGNVLQALPVGGAVEEAALRAGVERRAALPADGSGRDVRIVLLTAGLAAEDLLPVALGAASPRRSFEPRGPVRRAGGASASRRSLSR